MKKIFVISAGRSDYDRYLPILDYLNKSKVKLYVFLASSHSQKKFGETYKFINKKFNILRQKNFFKNLKDNPFTITKRFANDLVYLSKNVNEIKPDIIIVLGDRYEMLLGPIIAMPFNIPVIHFYGGSVTEGAIDELTRHAITKMSHIHFVALNKYKKRLVQLGEERWRIRRVGVHALQYIKSLKLVNKRELSKELKFNFMKPYCLLTFHPVTIELHKLANQLKSLAQAVKSCKINAVITYPNADYKNSKVISFIKKKFKDKKKFKIIKNCGLKNYINIMKNSQFVIGNSSSGIVESASFNIPVVNIGTRQDGKYKPKNVIDVGYSRTQILRGIELAQSKKFKNNILRLKNPYETNLNIGKLVNIILKLKKNDKVMRKKFIDIND